MYIKEDLLQAIGSHNYRGWEIPPSANWRPRKSLGTVISVWVCRAEHQESQECKSTSEGRRKRDEMSQLRSEAEEKHGKEFLLPPPVVLFRPPTRGGQSVFQSPLTQMLIWSQTPSQTHPEVVFNSGTSGDQLTLHWPSPAWNRFSLMDLKRNQSYWHLDLELLTSRRWDDTFCCWSQPVCDALL